MFLWLPSVQYRSPEGGVGRHPVEFISTTTVVLVRLWYFPAECRAVDKGNCLRCRPLAVIRSKHRVCCRAAIYRSCWRSCELRPRPPPSPPPHRVDDTARRKVNWRANYLRRKIRNVAYHSTDLHIRYCILLADNEFYIYFLLGPNQVSII